MVPKANPAGIESTVVNTTTVTATIMLEVMRLSKSPSSQATRNVCRLNELGRLSPDSSSPDGCSAASTTPTSGTSAIAENRASTA